jgi:hypothetical protein
MNYLQFGGQTAIKKQPLDPICAMCRIISLNFKNIQTKIGVNEHTVSIQEPQSGQSLTRFYYGDSRENIFELFHVVIHLIAWFLVAEKSEKHAAPDPQLLAELQFMIPYMCGGLRRLQDTYKTGNVVLTLQYYVNMLLDGLKGTFDVKNALPKCLAEDLGLDTALKDSVVAMWKYDRLHVIRELYDHCFRALRENTSSRDGIIEGYLSSIDKLLNIYETEFRQQLKQGSGTY